MRGQVNRHLDILTLPRLQWFTACYTGGKFPYSPCTASSWPPFPTPLLPTWQRLAAPIPSAVNMSRSFPPHHPGLVRCCRASPGVSSKTAVTASPWTGVSSSLARSRTPCFDGSPSTVCTTLGVPWDFFRGLTSQNYFHNTIYYLPFPLCSYMHKWC